MSDSITFTGVVLKNFSRNHNGGRANFSANYTAPVGLKMGWAGFPEGATSVTSKETWPLPMPSYSLRMAR